MAWVSAWLRCNRNGKWHVMKMKLEMTWTCNWIQWNRIAEWMNWDKIKWNEMEWMKTHVKWNEINEWMSELKRHDVTWNDVKCYEMRGCETKWRKVKTRTRMKWNYRAWISEWVNEWVKMWVNEWVSEWMNEWVSVVIWVESCNEMVWTCMSERTWTWNEVTRN